MSLNSVLIREDEGFFFSTKQDTGTCTGKATGTVPYATVVFFSSEQYPTVQYATIPHTYDSVRLISRLDL